MYIIEEGKAYFVKGKKAYAISFDLDKKMEIDEKDSIDVENQPQYSYDVMYKKMNIDYMIEQEKASQGDNAEINALKKENEALKAEIKELKALIEKEPSEEEQEPSNEPSEEPNGELNEEVVEGEPKGEEDDSKEESKKLNKEGKK